MQQPRSMDMAANPRGKLPARILCAAAWFGLVSGLVEGVWFLALDRLGGFPLVMERLGFRPEIIWIAALMNLLLFGLLGVVLAAMAWWFPRLPMMRVAVAAFAFAAFCDWLADPERLHVLAVLFLAGGLAAAFARWFSRHEAAVFGFWRRSLPWAAVTTLLFFGGTQTRSWLQERMTVARLPVAVPGLPNIMVIIVDTLRADRLGCYGYGRATSPHVDRLARQGVLFESAFSASSWTPPSHASLLTGRYLYEHGCEWNRALDGRYATLPEVLGRLGYRTGAFSGNPFWFGRRMGLGRGFQHFDGLFHSPSEMALRPFYGRRLAEMGFFFLGLQDDPTRKRAADTNRAVLRWIEQAGRDRPFFVMLNYLDVHAPYLPPAPYRVRFSRAKSLSLHDYRKSGDRPQLSPERLQAERDAYDGAIAYMDDQVGQLLGGLQQRGLAENTLVVLTADHGELFGEHGLIGHRNSLYRKVVHVPLIFSWPGRLPGARRMDVPVSNTSLAATIMDLLGRSQQTPFPCPSLARLWREPSAAAGWPYPLMEIARQPLPHFQGWPSYDGAIRSLVNPRWQYIEHETRPPELYNWRADPEELKNLADTREGRLVAKEFAARMRGLVTHPQKLDRRVGKFTGGEPSAPETAQVLESF